MSPIRIPDPAEICLTIVMTVFVTHTVGVDAEEFVNQNINAKPHICASDISQSRPFSDPNIDRAIKFQRLTKAWQKERGASSSITKALTSPSYLGIIGMGEPAVPLIMAQLRAEGDDPDQWFWALEFITGENPTKPEDQGDSLKMAEAWLAWSAENDAG